MGPTEIPPRHYTVEEYLAREVKSEARHDFYEGRITERSSDAAMHNTIVMNCMMAFRRPCDATSIGCTR